MKKRLFLIPLAVFLCLLCALVLVACDGGGDPVCQHRDADDNALCDKCGESYTDGADVAPPTHTHSYDQKVKERAYLKSDATADTPAVYYYSCTCGEAGEDVFSLTAICCNTSPRRIKAFTWSPA